MTQEEVKLQSPSPAGDESSTDALDRWLQLLRQRVSNSAARMFSRFLIMFGFLGSAYILGWGEIPVVPTIWHYLALLVFPIFGLGLYWFSRQLDDASLDWDRWWKLLPLGFFLAALRHLTHSWVFALSVWAISVLASLLFHFLRHRQYIFGERLRQTAWDSGFLLLCLTNLFIPRAIFASLVVFIPIVLLVVFYNFILERDRLMRAKALAIGAPPQWLRRANRLLPSSTYLFLLLPGLLFAEAMLFHAIYQKTHPPAVTAKEPYLAPRLRHWLSYTVTVRMRARFKPSTRQALGQQEVIYREFGRGYSLTAGLIRGFLIFFYAKRLLLIFLLLMEATQGIRVHRIGEIEGVEGAGARLNEQKQVLLRTLDSFPRAWAGFILRGVQGKHGFLDPLGGIIYYVRWLRSQFLPRIIPGMKPKPQPGEPAWSRLVREEQISLLGQMQDRAWVLEAFIDLVSPVHSSTIRGKLYHHADFPVLRSLSRFYFQPPETEVRARIIHEMAAVIQRAIESGQARILFSDTETQTLTSEQVWALRDRALLVLGDLAQAEAQPIRLAAAQTIAHIASLPRPVAFRNPQLWEAISQKLSAQLAQTIQHPEAKATPQTTATSHPEVTQKGASAGPLTTAESYEARDQEDGAAAQEQVLDKMEFPDPFQRWLEVDWQAEIHIFLQALGTIGVQKSVEALQTNVTDDSPWRVQMQECLGLGSQASGHPQAGFPWIQELLLQRCQDTSLPEDHRFAALGALVRLAYPYPIAHAYVQLRQRLQQHKERFAQLEQLQVTLQTLETTYQDEATEALREELWQTYRLRNQLFATYEREANVVLQNIQDTFWTTLHYSAVILISAYIAGEGSTHTPEFTDFLSKLSLEDPQGWSEFLANLPPFQDPTSGYAPYDAFCRWTAGIEQEQGVSAQQGMFQRFLELKGRTGQLGERSDASQEWQEIYRFIERYVGFLYEVLLQWAPCLQHRPTLYVQFAEEANTSRAWWRLTLTGVSPWLQSLTEAPHHVASGQVYLAYEQFTPLQLSPLTQFTWEHQPTAEAFLHGHIPGLHYWGYNFHRSPQLHLRQIDVQHDRGYWRSPEKLDSDASWRKILQRLASSQESRQLTDVDLSYLRERSQASFQRVLARSRLREQDALMIVRDFVRKLDQFLSHSRQDDPQTPSIFLLSGNAGVGLSTLLLQHARQQLQTLQQTEDDTTSPRTLVFFLDVGLLESTDNLATWLHKELQLQVDVDEANKLRQNPLQALDVLFAHVATLLPKNFRMVLYLDGFHEMPGRGIPLFAQALRLAEQTHATYPWLTFVLAIRRSFLETNLEHPALEAYVSHQTFQPPADICYRERGSVYGAVMELTPFEAEAPQGATDQRSELERAYQRYYSFTDTSGSPRYRPQLQDVTVLETFGLTRGLLSHPALLPIVMETYHQRELPNDLHLLELFTEYTQQFSEPEQLFLQRLTRRMLFGDQQLHMYTEDPTKWQSDVLLAEKDLLEDRELSEYIETFKYGYSIYDSLRSRGLLIRRWRTPRHSDTESPLPERHVTFTSYQLQEYLVFHELQAIAPDWSKAQEIEQHDFDNGEIPEKAAWLLQLTQHSQTFRPLEGALMLLLLHLIEHRYYQVIANFNDYSRQQGLNSHHLLFGALQHLSPQAVTQMDGPLPTILKDLSENDLHLLDQLGRHWKRRGLYQEVDALYRLVLDHPQISEQLPRFPDHFTELLLERADNHRQILAQRSGGQLTPASYQEGRSYYERALERIEQHHPSPLTQARVLRFLALYEMDTNHLEDARTSLQRAWQFSQQAPSDDPAVPFEQAWIRHFQSALTRRQIETSDTKLEVAQHKSQLEQARDLGQEALTLALRSSDDRRTELLAQLYDNLARILSLLAQEETGREQQLALLQEAIDSFEGSLRAKRALNDFLGLAISHSGLGDAYQKRAALQSDEAGIPHTQDWNTARSHFEQGLAINRDQLHSDFGVALSQQALASLYLIHPNHHTEGISALLEALLSFTRINYRQGSLLILQKLVGEIASLPVHELYRLVQHIVTEIQSLQQQSEWLLEAFWKELQSVLGDSIPRMVRDFFRPFFSNDPPDS